jgi:two-component system CheB/CheR fusion protein
VIDVHARKLAEQALVETDRRKDEFIAMLGHELRNPLAAIRTATDVLELASIDDPRRVGTLDTLDRQSHHMTRLVDGLLDVSRIAQGKLHLELRVLDLRDVLEPVLRDHARQAATRRIDLHTQLPDAPVWVLADDARLVQICENLLANALKFTDINGSVTVTLTASTSEREAVIRVRDTGVGIRPEMLQHVFEPFQQDVQDLARARGGLGLGLAVAKGLVTLHHGSIEARSAGLGTGTELRVRIPLSEAPSAASELPDHAPAPPTRILVVDDNSDVTQMLRDALELCGHSVLVASNADEALAVLRHETVELVFCDIGMPGISGYDFARQVRADVLLRDLTLIAMSGYGQPEDRKRAHEAGFDDHLVKPMDVLRLDKVVSRRRP